MRHTPLLLCLALLLACGEDRPLTELVSFPDEAGLAFTRYGLVQDPYESTSEQPRHLGVGEGAPMGSTPTLARWTTSAIAIIASYIETSTWVPTPVLERS